MPSHLKVALAQYSGETDPISIIARAQREQADVVLFPKMFSNGHAGFDPGIPGARERWQEQAEPPDGSYIEKFRHAAREFRIHVVATFLEAAKPKPFNSELLIDPQGNILLHHRKVHICDFDVPEKGTTVGLNFVRQTFRRREDWPG